METKPKQGFFAGIKLGWQKWAADKNIVKKIFWFIWLVIWTVVKCVFVGLFVLCRTIGRSGYLKDLQKRTKKW